MLAESDGLLRVVSAWKPFILFLQVLSLTLGIDRRVFFLVPHRQSKVEPLSSERPEPAFRPLLLLLPQTKLTLFAGWICISALSSDGGVRRAVDPPAGVPRRVGPLDVADLPGHLQAVGGQGAETPREGQAHQEDLRRDHLRVGGEGERALRGHGETQGGSQYFTYLVLTD